MAAEISLLFPGKVVIADIVPDRRKGQPVVAAFKVSFSNSAESFLAHSSPPVKRQPATSKIFL